MKSKFGVVVEKCNVSGVYDIWVRGGDGENTLWHTEQDAGAALTVGLKEARAHECPLTLGVNILEEVYPLEAPGVVEVPV